MHFVNPEMFKTLKTSFLCRSPMENIFNSTQSASSNDTSRSSQWMGSGIRMANIVLDVVILVVSVFGNSLVISTIVREKKLQTTCNFLLLHLAISDISLVLLGIPLDIYSLIHGNEWDFGFAFCKLLWPANTLFYTTGPLLLTIITIDRYRVFVQTFKAKLRRAQAKKAIALAYVFSIMCIVPYSLALQLEEDSCYEAWPKYLYRQIYTVFLFAIQYGLPLLVMFFLYVRIGLHLTRKTQRVRLSRLGPRSKISLYSSDKATETRCDKIRKQRNKKALKMIIVVVIVFAVFMLPFQLIWIIADLGETSEPEQLSKLSKLFVIFSYIGSCTLNPFIFGVGDRRFRKGYQSILNSLIRFATAQRRSGFRVSSDEATTDD